LSCTAPERGQLYLFRYADAAHDGVMTCHLAAGRVLRVEAPQRVSRLSVVDGCLWLTTTPADGDVLLRAGDTWHADGQWPVVVQAMRPTVLTVSFGAHRSAFTAVQRALAVIRFLGPGVQ
jgi:hypothetical protein